MELSPINHQHTGGGALDWDPWPSGLPVTTKVTSVLVKFATSPGTSEILKVVYKPPTDGAGVAGAEFVVRSNDPSAEPTDERKQNWMFSLNQEFAKGGIFSVQFPNASGVVTIDLSVEHGPVR